ncbi:MAG: B12-binding domain-containing radical SAM protein [Candidatus Omnitrophica bacterium]|nr:B12-binding domain-containing radical SAM protein [Candidatus Omnitrophota bacterium]
MNIALIRPPKISGAFEKILIQEPINLVYLGTYLKSKGFQATIIDFEVEPFNGNNINYLLKKHSIELVGITAMTPTINNAHEAALLIKQYRKDLPIVVGGPHVSAIPDKTLREFPAFDYAVMGEGELPMLNLCENIMNQLPLTGIAGIAGRNSGKIFINKPADYINNLDTLPLPDRSLLNQKLYTHAYAVGINKGKKRSTVVFTSRGCSQKCIFCAVEKTTGDIVRFKSAGNVIGELKDCRDRFGYNHITFEDTNLTLSRKRFIEICRGLKSLKLSWDCQTKVSLVDEELISIMKDCGCLKIAYGVESGSPKILSLIKKNITITQVKKAFELTHRAKIVACAFFILGSHPQENADDIRLTEKLIHEIKPDVFQLGIICPYPGTEIFRIMKNEGLITDIDWKKFNFMHSKPPWRTKYLSSKDLIKFQKQIYINYIFSLSFIGSLLLKMLDPAQALNIINLSFYMLKYLLFEKRR